MAVKYKLQDVSKLNNRKIFVDANVLIYLFWPTGTVHWENNYASAFARLLKQKNQLFVDFCVLSEVINRMIRIEPEIQQKKTKYKNFRDSQEGKNVLMDIYLIVKEHILKKINITGKVYEREDIEAFLIVDELDFIDKSTVSICNKNNFVLFTDYKDFKNSDIDILTGNPFILKS